MLGELDQIYVDARRALLDALDALGPHAAALVLVGAQAIYIHTGDAEVAVAVRTKDGDLAVDPRELQDQPSLESAMVAAGFRLSDNPGIWLAADTGAQLLVAVSTPTMAGALRGLLADPISAPVTRRAVTYLGELFGTAGGIGSRMAARAVVPLMDSDTIAQSSAALAHDLLEALK